MSEKITAIYFSATGNSKTSACAIAEVFSKEYQVIDVTKCNAITKEYKFDEQDIVIFSAPVYGGRVYQGAMSQFAHCHGYHTKCIVTVTYGNRHYDDALLEFCETVEKQGFIPIAAAALIGQHTYGNIQVGRPDEKDRRENQLFAEKVKEKIANGIEFEPVKVPGNHPYREGGDGGRFRPRTDERCENCGLCVRDCPENAIAEDCVTIDNDKCIACFRCIRHCPLHAKNMDAVSEYQEFAKEFTQRLSVRRENEYFI